jgi:type IV pilus assembly protein PilV
MKPTSMTTGPQQLAKQGGVMLLEAMLAILIFSLGVLAIVGMQATAVQDMGESKYRTDAALLANQVLADMWGNSQNLADYAYAGGGAVPPQLQDWVATVQAKLPGATAFPPIVAVGANNQVTVTVRWRAAREAGIGAAAHQFQTVAYITCCL